MNTVTKMGWTVFAIGLAALPAAPLSASAASLTVTRKLSQQQQDAAEAYWTREAISAAPAFPMPVDDGSGTPDPAGLRDDGASGPLGRTAPREAAWDGDLVAQSAYWRDWLAIDEEAPTEPSGVIAGTSGVYTYYDVNNYGALWQIYPHKWVGKLTFVTPSGSSSCSATVIAGNNVVTAAHCVYDTAANRFYSGWVFTPAFRNGSTPYGTFTASACTVLTAWVNLTGSFDISTWSRHDVAVCTLNRNSAGQTVNQAIGWAGRMWNADNKQQVFSAGYPARIYTDALISVGPAQFLRACTAESFSYATQTLGSGCYWGRGSSGGPWLVQYKPFVVSGFVDSVNSGLFLNQQNTYGARFNGNNIVPLCTVRGC